MIQNKIQINWKRVLLYVLLFCILIIIFYLVLTFRQIYKSKVERFDKVEAFVYEHTTVNSIENIEYFQDEEGYYTLIAEDRTGEKVYVFLRNDKKFSKNHLYIVKAKDMVAPESLESELKSDCISCELIRSTPAMIDGIPLWELTYIDNDDRYVIEYKYLENGETYEKLRLSRKYKKE